MSRKPLLFATLTFAFVAQAVAAPGRETRRVATPTHGKPPSGALIDKPADRPTPQEQRRDGWSGFYFGINAGSGRAEQ